MPHAPLCALVHASSSLEPQPLAASARACLADIRLVLDRHGFTRTANALLLARMALEDDLAEAQAMEAQEM
ncbi:MAG TPA: hypothetical protein VLL76_00120, partial [Candidatus Omnitrophota bacterium]|nr:hypothetical protein [Candidatus Omnitrophota bacterium]